MPAMQHLFMINFWQRASLTAIMTFASRRRSLSAGGVRYYVRE